MTPEPQKDARQPAYTRSQSVYNPEATPIVPGQKMRLLMILLPNEAPEAANDWDLARKDGMPSSYHSIYEIVDPLDFETLSPAELAAKYAEPAFAYLRECHRRGIL
jgi:hypothetical protein